MAERVAQGLTITILPRVPADEHEDDQLRGSAAPRHHCCCRRHFQCFPLFAKLARANGNFLERPPLPRSPAQRYAQPRKQSFCPGDEEVKLECMNK